MKGSVRHKCLPSNQRLLVSDPIYTTERLIGISRRPPDRRSSLGLGIRGGSSTAVTTKLAAIYLPERAIALQEIFLEACARMLSRPNSRDSERT
jgi:hypothetical protein